MGSAAHSLEELRQDLDETQSVIEILERASRELVTIINYDDSVRSNPLRGDYQEFRVRAGRTSSQAAIAFEKRSANMTAI
jgi:hypothetical protein